LSKKITEINVTRQYSKNTKEQIKLSSGTKIMFFWIFYDFGSSNISHF